MRDLHAFREQSGLRLKREAGAQTAQRAELLREEEVAAPKTKKAKKRQTLAMWTCGVKWHEHVPRESTIRYDGGIGMWYGVA